MKFNYKVFFSAVWLVFTFSLAAWWFLFVMESVESHLSSERAHKMIFWEGSTLLLFILVGGATLIFYIYKDQSRHDQMKLFFSSFSHEIKTSISRLRLQSELIGEDQKLQSHPVLKRLLTDINQLDLQLENSLYISHLDETKMLKEKVQLRELFKSLELEYPGLKFSVQDSNSRSAVIADSRALRSVLKNIFENSQRHGHASAVEIAILPEDLKLRIHITDNGKGSALPATALGTKPLAASSDHGSGIGLFLVRKLVEKMQGSIQFHAPAQGGLRCELILPAASPATGGGN